MTIEAELAAAVAAHKEHDGAVNALHSGEGR